MSVLASPRFLRHVLFADAASCLVTGAAQVFGTNTLAELLHLSAALLAGTGWFLLAYAALVALVALRTPVPRAPMWLFVAGNVGWAAACAALLASGAVSPTSVGIAWIVAQAITMIALAQLQWLALRGERPRARRA
jgi:hypothetical protein